MPARTPEETSTILVDYYQGANDIALVPSPFGEKEIARFQEGDKVPIPSTRHVPKSAFGELLQKHPSEHVPEELPLFRSYFQSAMSMGYVKHLLQHYRAKRLEPLIAKLVELDLNAENFHATLNGTVEAGFPGHFAHHCHDHYVETGKKITFTPYLTRFTLNRHLKAWCHSLLSIRQDICLGSVEDMGVYGVEVPHFFFNKMSPKYDYVAYHCWMQLMETRAKDPGAQTRRSHSCYCGKVGQWV